MFVLCSCEYVFERRLAEASARFDLTRDPAHLFGNSVVPSDGLIAPTQPFYIEDTPARFC
jgi:hypothetical protein